MITSEDFAITSSIISLVIAITTTISNHKLLSLNIQYLELYIKATESLAKMQNDLNSAIEAEIIKEDKKT
jgi:hypothetical protein